LVLNGDKRPLLSPQRCNLGQGDVLGRQSSALYAVVRIKENQIGFTD